MPEPQRRAGRRRRPTLRQAAAAFSAAGLVAVAWLHTHRWRFTADDAYISFRYAENLVRYGQLAFNPPGIDPHPVEGYTNLGWVLLLAAGRMLGAPIPELAQVLGRVSEAGCLLAAMALAARLSPAKLPGAGLLAAGTAAAFLALWPEFVVWGSGGLEGPLATGLSVASLAALTAGRPEACGLLAGLAGVVRPDALLVPAVFGVVRWAVGPGRRAQARHLLRAGAAAAVPVGAQLAFRWIYYGTLLPQTFAIKAGGAALAGTWGGAYLSAWARGVGWLELLPWWAAAAGCGRSVLPLAAAAATHLAYGMAVGGDFMAYGRLVLSATVLAAVGAGIGAAAVGGWLADRRWAGRALPVLLAVSWSLAGHRARVRHGRDMAKVRGWLDGRYEGVRTMDRFARVRVAAGRRLREKVPADTRVVVGAAGALPWASGLPAWDLFGLVVPGAPRLARTLPADTARPGHQKRVPAKVLERFDADLWCHLGYHGPHPPGTSRIPPPLRRTHRFACVRLGRLADPHDPTGTFAGGYYCCLRPRDRLTDVPFDAP